MSPSFADKTASTDPTDILKRSLDMLERSQTNLEGSLANLERIVAMENTILRLVDYQEELRRMVVAFIRKADARAASPTSIEKSDFPEPAPSVKNEEEKEDEIERTDLPATTPASPVADRDEEQEEISSVSSVSFDENVDLATQDINEGTIVRDSTPVNIPEGDEIRRTEYFSRGQHPAAKKFHVMEAQSSGKELDEKSDDEEDNSSICIDEEEITSGEDDPEVSDTEVPMPQRLQQPSAPAIPNSRMVLSWKCSVCEKMIKGDWSQRQYHIYSHEGLKLSCPVTGCSTKVTHRHLSRHLTTHGTKSSSLPAQNKAQLRRQLDRHNKVTLEFERKYFPPRNSAYFEETSRGKNVKAACLECGKFCVQHFYKRDHVGLHLNMRMSCPFRGCGYSGRAHSIKVHIFRMHGRTLDRLPKEERERFENSRRKFEEGVDAVMGNYFPEVLLTKRVPCCKKCKKEVSTVERRRDHVGAHLKAKFPCPFLDCGYAGREVGVARHLSRKHRTTLRSLSDEEHKRFDDARKTFHEQVNAVMGEYFEQLQ
uniref:C2H2-type domain-containing protein n=1 Tax=Steinernema glaseri TaxID=37863 RepID=A0A1I8APV9_9BILA